MRPTGSRPSLAAVLVLAAALVLTGCTGGAVGPDAATDPTTTGGVDGTGAADTTAAPPTTPARPSALTDESVREYAAAYGEAVVYDRVAADHENASRVAVGCSLRDETPDDGPPIAVENGTYRVDLSCGFSVYSHSYCRT